MEKNYFAAVDYRIELVMGVIISTVLASIIIVLGLFSATLIGLAAALSPLSLILPGVMLARRLGWPWLSTLPIPLMVPLFHHTLFNSAWKTLRQGGIRWRNCARETFADSLSAIYEPCARFLHRPYEFMISSLRSRVFLPK